MQLKEKEGLQMESVMEFKNVSFGYAGAKDVQILKEVNVSFKRGKFYAIIGPSGSGKTTALALAGALDEPQSGKVLFDGKDVREIGHTNHRRHNVALVFQNYNLVKYMSALNNVTIAMEISGKFKKERKERAMEMLKSLGLSEDEAKRNVMRLSGGQQQRVAIARALASDAPVILADEPTGNLDSDTSGDIVGILKKMAHEKDKCVIVVSHSHEIANCADVVMSFNNGSLKVETKK